MHVSFQEQADLPLPSHTDSVSCLLPHFLLSLSLLMTSILSLTTMSLKLFLHVVGAFYTGVTGLTSDVNPPLNLILES